MKPNANQTAVPGFSPEERVAMRERARELKPETNQTPGEATVLAKIAAMPPAERVIGERLHAIIRNHAPALVPKLWYGMPAYANADGNVVCFFQNATKFKARYSTLGFSDKARLDHGNLWPNAYALVRLTSADEATIAALLKRAVG